MNTIFELRFHARKLYQHGDTMHALRVVDAIISAAPMDYDARIKAADCLAALGEKQPAQEVRRQVAWYCLKGGHPLAAIVAARLVEADGGVADDILGALVVMYGSGSDSLGKMASRLAPPDPETVVPEPPDLRAEPPENFVAKAGHRAVHCLDGFEDYPDRLHPIPLLSEMSEENFRRVLPCIVVKRLPDGASVICEGEPGRSFFFVASGKVRVYGRDALGRDTELAKLHEGALFGEMALLGAQPRTASVSVEGEADLLEVSRETLSKVADELEQVAAALDRFTRDRLLKNLVASSVLFRPFSRVQQLDLLRRFTEHDVAEGTVIIGQGEEGRGLFVVLTGEVEVSKQEGNSPSVPIATLRAGDVFGEMALLSASQTTATVKAARHSTVLFLGREYFSRLISAVPEIANYFKVLAEDRDLETKLLLSDDQIVEDDEYVLL